MKVLITGITGMIGTCLEEFLTARGHEVFGIARATSASRFEAPRPNVLRGDIMDANIIAKVIRQHRPEWVFHLAAQAYNSVSWDCEQLTHATNGPGTLNLLQACREHIPNAKIMIACSSAEYGIVPPDEQPIREDRLLRPLSPYGVSKAYTEQLAYQYHANYGLAVYLPRLFIHVGPGHPPATAIQNFARQIALIRKKYQEPTMRVGNLDSARDFIDVRDGVAALVRIMESDRVGEPINVCTGKAHSIREVLNILLGIAGGGITVEEDPNLFRPSDEPLLLGCNRKLKELGWLQHYTVEQTLSDVFYDWLNRV